VGAAGTGLVEREIAAGIELKPYSLYLPHLAPVERLHEERSHFIISVRMRH